MNNWSADHNERQAGWHAACEVYWHLSRGGQLTAVSPGNQPEETNYANGEFGYARFYAYDPSVVLAAAAGGMHSNRVARKAEDMVRLRWRDHRRVPGLLSNYRVSFWVDDVPLSFWHQWIEGVDGDLERWWFALTYRDTHPLMVFGPLAPSLAVALFWLAFGEVGLRVPILDPIAVDAETWAQTPDAVRPPPLQRPPE